MLNNLLKKHFFYIFTSETIECSHAGLKNFYLLLSFFLHVTFPYQEGFCRGFKTIGMLYNFRYFLLNILFVIQRDSFTLVISNGIPKGLFSLHPRQQLFSSPFCGFTIPQWL